MERNLAAIELAIGSRPSAIQVQGHTDLTVDGLKFSGNSQRRRRKFLLFHGTFLLKFDLTLVTADVTLLRMSDVALLPNRGTRGRKYPGSTV